MFPPRLVEMLTPPLKRRYNPTLYPVKNPPSPDSCEFLTAYPIALVTDGAEMLGAGALSEVEVLVTSELSSLLSLVLPVLVLPVSLAPELEVPSLVPPPPKLPPLPPLVPLSVSVVSVVPVIGGVDDGPGEESYSHFCPSEDSYLTSVALISNVPPPRTLYAPSG